MKNVFRILIVVLLGASVASCSLLDNEAYQEIKRERAERGVRCYEDQYGNYYCEDKDGNRAY